MNTFDFDAFEDALLAEKKMSELKIRIEEGSISDEEIDKEISEMRKKADELEKRGYELMSLRKLREQAKYN